MKPKTLGGSLGSLIGLLLAVVGEGIARAHGLDPGIRLDELLATTAGGAGLFSGIYVEDRFRRSGKHEHLRREFQYIEQRCASIPNPKLRESVVSALHGFEKDWDHEILNDAEFSAFLKRVYRIYIAPTLDPTDSP